MELATDPVGHARKAEGASSLAAAVAELALALAVTAGQLGEADQEAEVAGGPALALAAAVGQPLWGMLLQELLLGPWRGSAGQHGWPLALCQKPSRKPRGLRQELRLRPFSYLDARVASAGGTLL